jgi:uncharacterized protein (DUF3820 family)
MKRYNEYMYTKLNFGKYKGYFVKDIPETYLVWAIQNINDVGIATMLSIEYQRRHKESRK